MNRGGKRIGSGRKSRIEELGIAEMLSEAITDEDMHRLFKVIYRDAMKGSAPHQKMILEYRIGKPAYTVNTTTQVSTLKGIDEIEIILSNPNRQ